jgi:DNA segregation ATPase FtsK/SpoIIIE, S-DNA-T family
MLELLAFPLGMMAVALIPSGGKNDKQKIKKIFENTGYGIRTKKGDMQYPRFKKKLSIKDGEEQIGTRYFFTIPLGLPATKAAEMEKNVGFFTDGLGRPVLVEFKASLPNDLKKYLTISVFNKELPNMYPFAMIPKLKEEDKKKWLIPLGRTLEETIWHNFDHTPHMTVAGTTRFGKTVFLKVLMTYLIEHHPNDVEFYIIDLKGGLEFGKYEHIEQVKAVASNIEESYDLLLELTNKQEAIYNKKGEIVKELELGVMEKDYRFFREKGWNNIVNTPIKKRRFIIVDEAAQLTPEKWMPEDVKKMLSFCQYALGEITRIGGALGFREIFCTQYPTSDTLPRAIKQNSDGKITFRLPSGYASDVAIDDRGAEKLPSHTPGRALYKTHELREMQVPFIDDEEMWRVLERYQVPRIMKGEAENVVNECREEVAEDRTNLVQFH